ncbi:hypothetical protein IWQ47_002893 [Aquimarina sp. EL_43]|uniref:DUF7878 domain-containing protein n=1 Tax=unclassified Aquimarina TaxID=2627091 RepID=UPI0018CB48D3|nr:MULTISPECIES: hypothetical protein [unclassified Aquimarina]MBG6131239.1 hypothetical protein [Aquimarina sp. EL_35]MBG6151879.1 hypothetical protein [Aquimarina sp. EL_32]MBG6169809.1 hypothetical protein [Aquimarina sp. EL_43]
MKIEFEITSIPEENKKQYFVAYLEGTLRIFMKGKLFFDSTDLLIAELGILLRRWVERIRIDQFVDFLYETMDSDESPILLFKYNGKDGFLIESVWREFDADKAIDKDELLEAVEDFLHRLDIELNQKGNVKLKELME